MPKQAALWPIKASEAMADIINLRRFKKVKLREEKAQQADVNRVKFGQSKIEKQLHDAQHNLAIRNLDGHKRDDA
jgi:Domain of unknown function (DUF4169)